MAHLAGKSGDVLTGGSTVGDVKSWTLDYIVDALETTDMDDDGVRNYIAGCSGWSGTFEVVKDGQPETLGTLVTLSLKESETSGQLWYATAANTGALLTGVHVTTSFDGVVTYTYDFQGVGALIVATA